MKTNWDVIVIGGGPGGLCAALETARTGKTVILFEKDRELGMPVRCAEGVSRSEMKKYFGKYPKSWVSKDVNTFTFVSPHRKEVSLKSNLYSGFTLDRREFECGIGRLASDEGAKIVTKADVRKILFNEEGNACGVSVLICGEEKEYRASVIIAADGVESRMGKQIGINTTLAPQDIESCVQVTVGNIDVNQEALYLYVGMCYAPGGYIWIFPKGNRTANIGLGINGKFLDGKKFAKDYLEEFMEEFYPDASVLRYVAGGVPVANTLKDLAGKNMLLVGDAGRMVSPISGGGISDAVMSGFEAGKIACAICDKPQKSKDLMAKYEKIIAKKNSRPHEGLYKIKKAVYDFTDDEFNHIADEILKVDIKKRNFLSLFKVALSNQPSMLKVAIKAFAGI